MTATPNEEYGCWIVGASHAGVQLAISLRQQGWQGPITLIGAEPHLPYHRPPLSKAFLTGKKTVDEIHLRPRELFEREQITLRLGQRVVGVDATQHTLTLEDQAGQQHTHRYDKLALCTGSLPRQLPVPGSDLAGIHTLRELDDVQAIQHSLNRVAQPRAVIVGGGYIGLEAAAALRQMDITVTLVELAPRLLSRVAGSTMADFFREYHQQHGVEILTGDSVEAFSGEQQLNAVQLASGRSLAADLAIVGIGIGPNDTLARAAGLHCDNGVVVDEFAQTSDPDIVAAGDCTNFPHPLFGRLRLESVPNATEQATSAAATLCGQQRPHQSLPWFWSDQYDCKLQMAGLSQGADETFVVGNAHAMPGERPSFAVFYFRQGHLLAVDAINRPKAFMRAKRWIADGTCPARDAIEAQV